MFCNLKKLSMPPQRSNKLLMENREAVIRHIGKQFITNNVSLIRRGRNERSH